MKIITIQDNNLKSQIVYELQNSENTTFYKEDLMKITTITIDGKSKNNCFEYLLLFPNLHYCTIKNYNIDNNKINIINSLKNLKELKFDTCNFEKSIASIDIPIQKLNLSFCTKIKYFNFSTITKLQNIKIILCKKINLKNISMLQNLEKLYLKSTIIKNKKELIKLENLKYLTINDMNFKNNQILNYIKSNSIIVEKHNLLIK